MKNTFVPKIDKDKDKSPLVLSGVTKKFGQLLAVSDVNLRIRSGEIFALLGPNGAGKTTLINCISGQSRQTEGTIEVFGADNIRNFRQTRKSIGVVPQEINFDPFFTPLQSLMIQMGLMGERPDKAWAEELLGRFALSKQRDAYTRNLSGGMKRRLLVAKALVHRPRLLFLDEPTAGVDVELRKELWDEVRKLRDQGTTIILTTHYLKEAEELADRVGIIHKGRLRLVEDRKDIMSRSTHSCLTAELQLASASLLEHLPEGSEFITPLRVKIPWRTPDELIRVLNILKKEATITNLDFEQSTLEDIFVELIHSADEHTRESEK